MARLDALGLDTSQRMQITKLVEAMPGIGVSVTTARNADQIWRVHIADSLVAVELEPIRAAKQIADLGSGAGLPGLVLAAVLPDSTVTLVDGVQKKVFASEELARRAGIDNVAFVWARCEEYAAQGAAGHLAHDLVTARALAALPVILEYAAPLLQVGGHVVAWTGAVGRDELDQAQRAGEELGFAPGELIPVHPYPQSRNHHLFVAQKQSDTPTRYPRRPGQASKRPLGQAVRPRT